ncbi:MAG: hypothetical protein A2521_05555 [Deltaproteobacteria bacterium RIFOXYD12_FULL_57_12]|nr:MAG: hypothetical protein A2521_05555 [Deltaproteobacteria bacterium RIFOXYD12_FULL_57_12]
MIRLAALNARYSHSCLALFHVRQELRAHLTELQVEMLQLTINDPYFATLQRLAVGEPAAVFFSVYIWNSRYVRRLVVDLVKLLPKTRIVLGGPQAPYLFSREQASWLPARCSVVLGEVEGLSDDFYEDLVRDRMRELYGSFATVADSRAYPFVSPYLESDFSGDLCNRHVYYESSRGCPFACSYCLSAARPGVRYKELDQVQAELAAILRHRPKVVRFVDRTFNDRPARALAIWRFLLDTADPATLFHFEMAPDRFTDEMLAFLEGMPVNRFQFELGIQSTNPETLSAINRNMDLPKTRTAISRLAALDAIHLHVDLILGLPYETAATFAASFNEVFALRPHYMQMGLLKVLPDTPMGRSETEFELAVCEEPPYEVMANRWLDGAALAELFWFGECVEAFYNNRFFRSLWRYLHGRGENVFTFFQSLLAVCQQQGFFELAATQKLMVAILCEFVAARSDGELIRELLAYDWLRCGHRFLPVELQAGLQAEPLPTVKNTLWRRLPPNLEGLYDYRHRDEFFKQGIFACFSGPMLEAVGLGRDGQAGYVCFLAECEGRVFGLSRAVRLPVE